VAVIGDQGNEQLKGLGSERNDRFSLEQPVLGGVQPK
jgi:hypothetical protein